MQKQETKNTAKLFMHGRSQAVRLPKEFQFEGRGVRVTSAHAEARPAARALAAVATFLRGLAENAEHLTRMQKWRAILSRAFQAFLKGRLLRAPPRLAAC